MEAKVEVINGVKKVVVSHKSGSCFVLQCSEVDVNFWKHKVNMLLKSFKEDNQSELIEACKDAQQVLLKDNPNPLNTADFNILTAIGGLELAIEKANRKV